MKPYIIDVHAHPFNEEDLVAYRAKANGRVKKTLVLHHKLNLDGSPFSMDELLRFVEAYDDLVMVGSVRTDQPIEPQLIYLRSLFQAKKIVGVKMYPGYEHFYPSDKNLVYPVAELCRSFGKPLIFHGGDVWDPDPADRALLRYSYGVAEHVDELAGDFPDLNVVIAHFNFPKLIECANVVSKRKNVYTDISGTIDSSDVRLLNQYCTDLIRAFTYFPDAKRKVMFGTDYCSEHISLNQFDPYVRVVERVFAPDEQESVFSATAERLFFS